MHKTFTQKRAAKDLAGIIGNKDNTERISNMAHKAAKELGFCCAVFNNRVVVQDSKGQQSVYTHVNKPSDRTVKGLLLTHAILKHKLH